MPFHPLADQAATLRSHTLTFLRAESSRALWNALIDSGASVVMPASWSAWPRLRQVEALVAAEDKRIADGTTFAMSSELAHVARLVGKDQELPLPFVLEALPAPSGMLAFSHDDPLMRLPTGAPVVAVTWGPPMDGFSAGVHLRWWAAGSDAQQPGAAARGPWVPMMPDFELHLSPLPFLDSRLYEPKVPSGLIYSAVPLRTVVAAWYVLTAGSTALTEMRPRALVTRELTELRAKRRGVRVATAHDAGAVRAQVIERATEALRDVDVEIPSRPTPADVTPQHAEHGVFDAALDRQLEAGHRRIADRYRTAADHWHRLEQQATHRYPGVFDHLEHLRARDGAQWPTWCWMPSIKVAAALARWYEVPLEQAEWDGYRIAALGAWRSGGRHSVLTTLPLPETTITRVPEELPRTMPAPGLGVGVDDRGVLHLMLAYLDEACTAETGKAELVLISNAGEPASMLEDVSKETLFLTGNDIRDAVTITQDYYDDAAAQNGDKPPAPTDADYAGQAHRMGVLTGLLAAICTPGADLQDAGALTGRKLPAPWPPEPGVLSEMTLWLLTGTPAAHHRADS